MNNFEYGFITKCAEYGVNPNDIIKFAQESNTSNEPPYRLRELPKENRKAEIDEANRFDPDKTLDELRVNDPRAYDFYINGGGRQADEYVNNVVMTTLQDPKNPFKPTLDGPYLTNPKYSILMGLANGKISEIGPGDDYYNPDPLAPPLLAGYNIEDKTKLLSFFKNKDNPYHAAFDPVKTMLHEHMNHNFRGDGYYIPNQKRTPYTSVYSNREIESALAAAYPQLETKDGLLTYNDEKYGIDPNIRTRGERGAINTELQWRIYKDLSSKAGRPITAEEFREGIKNLSDTELSQLFANKALLSGYLLDYLFNDDSIIDRASMPGGVNVLGVNSSSPMIQADLRDPPKTFNEFKDTPLYNLNKEYFDKILNHYSNPDPNREKIPHVPVIDGIHNIPHPDTINVPIKRPLPKEQLDAMRKTLMWFTRNKNNNPAGVSRNQRYLT